MGEQQTEVLERVARGKRAVLATEAATRRRIRQARLDTEADDEAARKGNLLPPPEREQHGRVIEQAVTGTEQEAARAGARVRCVQSPVERYHRRGSLNERQANAASDLRQDWEFGIAGSKNSDRVGVGGGTAGYSDAQLHAATLYREAVQAIGKRISAVVLPVVIGFADGGEITVEMLAKRRNQNREQVMGILKTGLDMLGDHYAECDDKRRAAKYG